MNRFGVSGSMAVSKTDGEGSIPSTDANLNITVALMQ